MGEPRAQDLVLSWLAVWPDKPCLMRPVSHGSYVYGSAASFPLTSCVTLRQSPNLSSAKPMSPAKLFPQLPTLRGTWWGALPPHGDSFNRSTVGPQNQHLQDAPRALAPPSQRFTRTDPTSPQGWESCLSTQGRVPGHPMPGPALP